ncbi:MAG: YqgE/AlgH family protein [Pseudomonadota bacterium]
MPITPVTELSGKLLIAMPGMLDDNFSKTTVLMCAHSDEGAMGLITNRLADDISFEKLVENVDLLDDGDPIDPQIIGVGDIAVHVGGPVEPQRGFVLHSPDYYIDGSSAEITGEICLTATVDILRRLAAGTGPREALLALGYAAWSPGQLETEIQANGWLHTDASADLIFRNALTDRYQAAFDDLGVDPSFLVAQSGRA